MIYRKFIEIIEKIYSRHLYKQIPSQIAQRYVDIKNFVYNDIEDLSIQNVNIVEDGRMNIFYLPNGEFPKFDFMLPQKKLFIKIAGPEWEDYVTAQKYGIIRSDWEMAQKEKACYLEFFPLNGGKSQFWLISWSEASDPKSLKLAFNNKIAI